MSPSKLIILIIYTYPKKNLGKHKSNPLKIDAFRSWFMDTVSYLGSSDRARVYKSVSIDYLFDNSLFRNCWGHFGAGGLMPYVTSYNFKKKMPNFNSLIISIR